MAKSDLKIVKWAIDKVIPYPQNVKKHDPDQVAGIVQSIKTFGWDQPIVVDKEGVIIKGHGRRLAAISLGLTEVPVLVRDDLTPAQVDAARLADNRAAAGDLDQNMLRLVLADIDLSLLDGIFDAKELEFSTADLGEINDGAFISDLDAAVSAQNAATTDKVAAQKEARVPLRKALGFSDIAGADEIYVTRLMAEIEMQTSLKGEAAFVTFAKSLVGEAA